MATIIVKFRQTRHSGWQRSFMPWTAEDVAFFNRTVGWEMYKEFQV